MISNLDYQEFVEEMADPSMQDLYPRLCLMRAATGLQAEWNEYRECPDSECISELGDILFWVTELDNVLGTHSCFTSLQPEIGSNYYAKPSKVLDLSEKLTRSDKIRSKDKKAQDLGILLDLMTTFKSWLVAECRKQNLTIGELQDLNYLKLTKRHS